MENSFPELLPTHRILMIDTPECTAREYARRTGMLLDTVKKMMEDGRIPTVKKWKLGQVKNRQSRAAVMVNVAKIYFEALAEA